MRVLVLTGDFARGGWSGVGAAVAAQTAALLRQGIGVDVLLPPGAAVPAEKRAVRIHVATRDRFRLSPRAFDVVHLHSLGFSELALELQTRFGLPLVYSAHALLRSEVPDFSRRSGWRAVQDRVLARSDHVVFLSAAEQRAATGLCARGSVLPTGVIRAATHRKRSADGPIVFAGRFVESKGVGLMREIVERLEELPFVFAGGHGDALGERMVAELVRRYPDRCWSTGWLAPHELDRLFSDASLVLVPSRYEPFGLVALEAMRAGAPVLAAAVGGLREIVGPGSGGLLVDSRRAEDWCEAILRLRHAPELRAELSRRGARWVAERYDADTLARTLIERVYQPLAAAARRNAA